jgi:tetratricopeptide (TPR) repeat protein
MEAIPGDSKYPLFLSSYLMRAGRLEEALTYADKALELSPKKQAILYQKGNILLNMGATKKAYEVFTEAYELATKNREAARFYAIAAVYAGEDAVAEEVMLKHFGTTTLAEIPLAQAYATRGQNDRALVIWKALYAASPNNAQYAFTVAATYIQLDQKEKALEVLAGVRERRPELSEQIDAYIAEIQGK